MLPLTTPTLGLIEAPYINGGKYDLHIFFLFLNYLFYEHGYLSPQSGCVTAFTCVSITVGAQALDGRLGSAFWTFCNLGCIVPLPRLQANGSAPSLGSGMWSLLNEY